MILTLSDINKLNADMKFLLTGIYFPRTRLYFHDPMTKAKKIWLTWFLDGEFQLEQYVIILRKDCFYTELIWDFTQPFSAAVKYVVKERFNIENPKELLELVGE